MNCARPADQLCRPFSFLRRACLATGGRKSCRNLMKVQRSEAHGPYREVGLQEAWSKAAGRWTRTGSEGPGASHERVADREVLSIKDTGGESGVVYRKPSNLSRGICCIRGFVTERRAIHARPATEVSSGRSTHASAEAPTVRAESRTSNSGGGTAPADPSFGRGLNSRNAVCRPASKGGVVGESARPLPLCRLRKA
jgi:hypothetical protein